jgi:RNA 3'-terminal phosphate cyclase (ATP)
MAPHSAVVAETPLDLGTRKARAMDRNRPITIDGSLGEGGGQVLRTALALSLLTGRPFRMIKVRANREKPGLRPQHLMAVEAAAALGGEAEGAVVGARELSFRPTEVVPRDLTFDIGTAGATSLVLHTLHLPLALRAESPVRLTLVGGTFNTRAPSFPFLQETWREHMARLGLTVAVKMAAAGYYPRGGGRLEVWIEPGTPHAITVLDRPPLSRLTGVAGTTNLDPRRRIGERLRDRALELLADVGLEVDAEVDVVAWHGPGQGTALALTAHHGCVNATTVGLGERGKSAERVADEAVEELLAYEEAEGAVDPHSADQLLLPLALAEGRSTYTVTEVTEHLRTNARIIGLFLDRPIRIEEEGEQQGRVIVG